MKTRILAGAATALLMLGACTPGADPVDNRPGPGAASKQEAESKPSRAADVCEPNLDWCQPSPRVVPAVLQRPLRLPKLGSGERCPTTKGRRYANQQFGGIALGKGPVQPLIGPHKRSDVAPTKRGLLRLRRSPERPGWYSVKTLWFSRPRYQGPVFIRARQLDGTHPLAFGESPEFRDPYLMPGPTINGDNGFRQWPGATWLRASGCYAWQIDGKTFSHVIVFKAEF